jgi:hypothetical protein
MNMFFRLMRPLVVVFCIALAWNEELQHLMGLTGWQSMLLSGLVFSIMWILSAGAQVSVGALNCPIGAIKKLLKRDGGNERRDA